MKEIKKQSPRFLLDVRASIADNLKRFPPRRKKKNALMVQPDGELREVRLSPTQLLKLAKGKPKVPRKVAGIRPSALVDHVYLGYKLNGEPPEVG